MKEEHKRAQWAEWRRNWKQSNSSREQRNPEHSKMSSNGRTRWFLHQPDKSSLNARPINRSRPLNSFFFLQFQIIHQILGLFAYSISSICHFINIFDKIDLKYFEFEKYSIKSTMFYYNSLLFIKKCYLFLVSIDCYS